MQNITTKIIFTIILGFIINNTTYAQTSGSGAVCVSQDTFTNAVLTCTVASLGATGASLAILNSTSCTACFTIPNPATCGICGILTIFGGTAVYLATQTCQPPEMEVCASPPPNGNPNGGGGSGGGSPGSGSGPIWDPGFGGGSGGGGGGGGDGGIPCPGGTEPTPGGNGVICHLN